MAARSTRWRPASCRSRMGEATKTVRMSWTRAKAYRFTMRFGEARDTDDSEGEVIAVSELRPTTPRSRRR